MRDGTRCGLLIQPAPDSLITFGPALPCLAVADPYVHAVDKEWPTGQTGAAVDRVRAAHGLPESLAAPASLAPHVRDRAGRGRRRSGSDADLVRPCGQTDTRPPKASSPGSSPLIMPTSPSQTPVPHRNRRPYRHNSVIVAMVYLDPRHHCCAAWPAQHQAVVTLHAGRAARTGQC
jgi:hypothetical protein